MADVIPLGETFQLQEIQERLLGVPIMEQGFPRAETNGHAICISLKIKTPENQFLQWLPVASSSLES